MKLLVTSMIRRTRFFLLFLLVFFNSSNAFAQLKVSILGDSYSSFYGTLYPSTNNYYYYSWGGYTDVRDVNQMWWSIVINHFGWTLERNCSFSGSFVCNTGDTDLDVSSYSFVERMTDMGNPDVILIMGGTNDAWRDSPMGDYKYENITYDDLQYFRPAMAKMLSWTLNHYTPNVYYVLNNGLREEVDESVKTVCAHYGVNCIELEEGMSRMSSHPTVLGMQQIASQVIAALELDPPKATAILGPVNDDEQVEEWFTLDGRKIDSPRKGLNIIRTKDGRYKKQMVH